MPVFATTPRRSRAAASGGQNNRFTPALRVLYAYTRLHCRNAGSVLFVETLMMYVGAVITATPAPRWMEVSCTPFTPHATALYASFYYRPLLGDVTAPPPPPHHAVLWMMDDAPYAVVVSRRSCTTTAPCTRRRVPHLPHRAHAHLPRHTLPRTTPAYAARCGWALPAPLPAHLSRTLFRRLGGTVRGWRPGLS